MIRLTEENLNTPEHFNKIWTIEGGHRFDRQRLFEFLRFARDGYKLLDVGCGLFGIAQFAAVNILCLGTELHAIDFCPEVEKVLKNYPRIKFTLGDVRAMPYNDAEFNYVASSEVIEHMEDPAAFAAELARVTKPGGYILVSTVDPHCHDAVRQGCSYPEHLWEFTVEDLLNMFKPFGESAHWMCGNYHMLGCQRSK